MNNYLFEYLHGGDVWGLEVIADTEADARAKVRAMAAAEYCGEIAEKVPVRNFQRPTLVAQNQN